MIRLTNIKVGIKKAANYDSERKALRNIILSKLRINEKELINYTIFKKSIDARKKDEIAYVYTLDVEVQNEGRILTKFGHKGIAPTPDLSYKDVQSGTEDMIHRPVIIGMGPAGLFAGLMLSRRGYKPITIPISTLFIKSALNILAIGLILI
jgi:uncharacterized FAD-dependent dehydrogenase